MFFGKPLADKDGKALAGVDAPSFRLLSDRWMRDRNRVYGQAQGGSKQATYWFYPVKAADPETFVPLNLRYAKDKNSAFYITNKQIRTRSVADFSIVPYAVNTIHGVESQIFDDSVYAKDAEHVYSAGVKIADADPAGFKQVVYQGSCNGDYFSDGRSVWFRH